VLAHNLIGVNEDFSMFFKIDKTFWRWRLKLAEKFWRVAEHSAGLKPESV
jgi:hypothetical protein